MSDSTEIVPFRKQVTTALQQYAKTLTNLPDADVQDALDFLSKLEKMSEEVKKTLARRVVAKVQELGKRVSDAGTLEAEIQGQAWRAIPTGTTKPDTNAVAALLLAKGQTNVNRFFTEKTEIVCTQKDLDIIVKTLNLLTPEEAATCMPKRNYRVEIKDAKPQGEYVE